MRRLHRFGREHLGFLLGLVGMVIFGLTLPATRLAVAELDPLFVTLGRALLAALFAALMLGLARRQPPGRRELSRLLLFSVCSILGFPLLMAFAMVRAPASHGAVVLAVLPLLTTLAGFVVAHERPSAGFWICGFAGTAAVLVYAVLAGTGSDARNLHWADIMLAGAALSAAMAYALGGEMARRVGGWEVISWALVFSAPPIFALLILLRVPINWNASASAWAGFLYVSVFSMYLGFFAWNKGMALAGISRISQMQLLQPFVALAASAALLGEQVGWRELAFAALVVGIVALSWRMRVART